MDNWIPPKTCVIGASGYIGSALLKAYRHYHPDTIGTDYRNTPKSIDLANNPDISDLNLNSEEYPYAIISAAITSLLACEKSPLSSHQINVTGTIQLVEQLCKINIVPIVFSSDYVFDGITGCYDEASAVNPLNEYGRQKVELERLIEQNFPGNYILIRLSKIYGLEKSDNTLIDQIIHSLLTGKQVFAAADQIFSPISLPDVVNGIIEIQKHGARGVYNLCGNEKMSRLELARRICETIGGNQNLIIPITLKDLKEPFIRPKRTDLVNEKIRTATQLNIRSLSSSVEFIAEQYQASGRT